MKNKKMITLCVCAVLTVVSILSSCGIDSQTSTDGLTELTYLKQKPREEQTIFGEAEDKTGVRIKFTLSENNTDYDQTLALKVASKELDDIIPNHSRDNFVKYGMQGALIPLNDLIEEYAPNYKKFLDENPDVKKYTTASDGNIYYIPFVQDGETAQGWFIRQDWLDKLGLKVPDTIDDFYNVMVAFRDNDPNGNGQKDEVPAFGMGLGSVNDLAIFYNLFNTSAGIKYTDDGKAVFGPFEEQFKVAMLTIRKWYAEKLIDNEIFTRTNTREYFLSNNIGGITNHWFGSTAGYNDMYKDAIEGFNFVPMAPPAGIDGIRRELTRRDKGMYDGWAISATNKNPEKTMQFFDYWWSEEGRIKANFGIEGITYEMKDGKPQLTELVTKNKEYTAVDALANYGAMTNFGFWQDFAYEEQWANPLAVEGMRMYVDNKYIPDKLVKLTYIEEEEEQKKKLTGQIETYLNETIQKWILGQEDIETGYDAFISQLKNLGADELVKIEQAAYDRYLSE